MPSFLPFLLLHPRMDSGHLVGRSQAAIEEGTAYLCVVIRIPVGFCCTAAVPFCFWTGDSCGVTRPTTIICGSDHGHLVTKSPLLLHCPQSSAGPQSTRPFHIPTRGPTGTSGALGARHRPHFTAPTFLS